MEYNYSIGLIDEKCNFVYKANAELNYSTSSKKKQTRIEMAIIQIDPIVGYMKNVIKKKTFYIHFENEQYVVSANIVNWHHVNQEWHFNITGKPTDTTIAIHMKNVSIGKSRYVTMLLSKNTMVDTVRRLTF